MALATKFQIVSTSDIFGQITVNIKLDGYAGAVLPLEAAGRDWIELKVGDSSNDISNPILGGKLSFSFYVPSDFQTTELGRSEIYTYYVECLDKDLVLIWAGWVVPDQYKEAYHNTPYIATVQATDGLEELKNINYDLGSGKADLMTHIIQCLNSTRMNLNIHESINIYSNDMDSGVADSSLKQAEVAYNSFRVISETPNKYDVLKSLLQPFFARIYQYRGWRIENILEKRSTYTVRKFSNDGNYVSQSEFDPLVKFNTNYATFRAFLQKSGQLSIRPALNNAEVYFNTVEPTGESTTGGFQTDFDWESDTELKAWEITEGVSNPITIQRVNAGWNGYERAVLIDEKVDFFQQDVNFLESIAYPVNSDDFQTINLSFSYYANFPSIVIAGSKPILYFQVIFTEAGSGIRYFYTNEWSSESTSPLKNRIDFSRRKTWKTYNMSIDRVPGNGTIKFRFYKLVKSGSTGVTELRLTGWKTNLLIEQPTNDRLLLEGATTNAITNYKGPSFQHYISDGIVLNAAGVMDVADTLTATWARRGVNESLNIRRLFLLQWLSFNSTPTEILTGTIYQKGEVITPMSVIKDKDEVSSVKYIMQNFVFNLANGIGTANYRQINSTDAILTYFEEFLNAPRPGDYFPEGFFPLYIPGAPGSSIGSNPVTIPNFDFSQLNGDVRGNIGQSELTPSAIVNKSRLDLTGLTANDIVFNAVKNDSSQENMTNLRVSDIKNLINEGNIQDIFAGTNITIDKSDPLNPIINSVDQSSNSVSYIEDQSTKTEIERQQARDNIDVMSRAEVTGITGELINLNTADKSNLVIAINQKGQYRSVGW